MPLSRVAKSVGHALSYVLTNLLGKGEDLIGEEPAVSPGDDNIREGTADIKRYP